MKLTRLLVLAAALAGTAALLPAGPDSRTFMLPKTPAKAPAAKVTAAPATTPAAPATAMATCATCACCQKAT